MVWKLASVSETRRRAHFKNLAHLIRIKVDVAGCTALEAEGVSHLHRSVGVGLSKHMFDEIAVRDQLSPRRRWRSGWRSKSH
ncbi:hypothetical protein KCV07_g484, partial [Aureobasidium melanogenum]